MDIVTVLANAMMEAAAVIMKVKGVQPDLDEVIAALRVEARPALDAILTDGRTLIETNQGEAALRLLVMVEAGAGAQRALAKVGVV